MKWILKLRGVFNYKTESEKSAEKAVENFLNRIVHTGNLLSKKYGYIDVEKDLFEINVEVEIENSFIRKNDVISALAEEFGYTGCMTDLTCEVKRKNYHEVLNRFYDVEYVIYRQLENGEWHTFPKECVEGPYQCVTRLKDDTMNVIAKYLSSHNCKNGEYMVDATITTNGEWYDSDTFVVKYENGKIHSLYGE